MTQVPRAFTVTVVAPPPPGSLPSWIASMALWEWKQVPLQGGAAALSNVYPDKPFGALPALVGSDLPQNVSDSEGVDSIFYGWGGLAVTPEGDVYAWGGGHRNYAGNEVYRLRLNDGGATPYWQRLSNPPIWSQVGVSNNPPDYHYNLDNPPTPVSCHSYYSYGVSGSKLFLLGGAAAFGIGFASRCELDVFNIPANINVAGGTWTINQEPDSQFQTGNPVGKWHVVRDPFTANVYAVSKTYGSQARFGQINTTTNRWTELGRVNETRGIWNAAAFDGNRKRIINCGNGDNVQLPISYWQIGGGGGTFSLTGPNVFEFESAGNDPFFTYAYDPSGIDCLLRKTFTGRTIYRMDGAGNQPYNCYEQATTGVLPTDAYRGKGGGGARFQYIQSLKGCIYIPWFGHEVFFLRTSL